MRIILDSYKCMIHLSHSLTFTLGSCLFWTHQLLHKNIQFFSSVMAHCSSSNNIKWHMKMANWFYLTYDFHHRRQNRVRTDFLSTHRYWNFILFLRSFSEYKWLIVNSKDQAPITALSTYWSKIISPLMMCTCMKQIEFQFRYSFMRISEEKKISASTLKNDEFDSVEAR
jgi:hypothetical protein